MVNFDAQQPGTPAEVWAADARMHNLPLLQLGDAQEVVIIGAHPDDETLGAGALIRLCYESGRAVRIVCVTDGSASHPDTPLLSQTRNAELTRAIDALAPGTPISMLGFPDGRTREHRAEITAALNKILQDVSPGALLVCPWRGDGHRDHRIVGEIVADIAKGRRLLEYPIWMWHWASPKDPRTPWGRMLSLPHDDRAKERAVACFGSQISGDSPMLHADFLEHFSQGQEVFIVSEQILGEQYFDAVYVKSDDPWRFRTRWYERRKRNLTVASLPHPHYQRALEIGCSNGMLTEMLASRCDELVAVDISEKAVAHARQRVGTRVDVRVLDVLTGFPEGTFDLIVLSEVGYYWGRAGLERVLDTIRDHLTPGGVFLACHWRHPVDDYPINGDTVHSLIESYEWKRLAHHSEADFLLEVFSDDRRSVAEQEGLL